MFFVGRHVGIDDNDISEEDCASGRHGNGSVVDDLAHFELTGRDEGGDSIKQISPTLPLLRGRQSWYLSSASHGLLPLLETKSDWGRSRIHPRPELKNHRRNKTINKSGKGNETKTKDACLRDRRAALDWERAAAHHNTRKPLVGQ